MTKPPSSREEEQLLDTEPRGGRWQPTGGEGGGIFDDAESYRAVASRAEEITSHSAQLNCTAPPTRSLGLSLLPIRTQASWQNSLELYIKSTFVFGNGINNVQI